MKMNIFMFLRRSAAKGQAVRPRIDRGGLSLFCLILGFCTGFANLCPAQTTTNFTFNEVSFSNWTSAAYGGYPQQSWAVETNGGDPGSYLQVETTIDTQQATELYDPAFTYNPALGAISNVAYSVDTKEFSTFGEGMACAVLLVQNGVGFIADYHDTLGTETNWTFRSTTVLVATNFTSASSQHPNFSSSGSPISFGLWTYNDCCEGITVGFDNFDVTFEVQLVQPLLTIQESGTNVVLTWTNSAFGLQAAPALTGAFTNVSGAASPYTNAITSTQQFFRLQAQ